MKQYVSIALGLFCAILVISLVLVKRADNVQHDADAGTIVDYSNRLDLAQMKIAFCQGTMVVLSNSLDESWSTAFTLSNQLMEAQSAVARDTEQIATLNRRVTATETENQTLTRQFTDLTSQMTNQVASLTQQLTITRTNLDQANQDLAVLGNRLRRDVAERLVVERKFNNPVDLQAQIEHLKKNPAAVVSAESIYAELDVEVRSNGMFYVLAPD